MSARDGLGVCGLETVWDRSLEDLVAVGSILLHQHHSKTVCQGGRDESRDRQQITSSMARNHRRLSAVHIRRRIADYPDATSCPRHVVADDDAVGPQRRTTHVLFHFPCLIDCGTFVYPRGIHSCGHMIHVPDMKTKAKHTPKKNMTLLEDRLLFECSLLASLCSVTKA